MYIVVCVDSLLLECCLDSFILRSVVEHGVYSCMYGLLNCLVVLKLVFSFEFSQQIFPLKCFFLYAGFFPRGCGLSP